MFKFKSEAAADLIMLETAAKQLLMIIGKSTDHQGILLPEDMPQAKAALEQALAQAMTSPARSAAQQANATEDERDQPAEEVSLRTRLWPFITMIERCLQANKAITWGV